MEGSVNFILMGLVIQKIQCHLTSLNPSWTKKKNEQKKCSQHKVPFSTALTNTVVKITGANLKSSSLNSINEEKRMLVKHAGASSGL